MDKIDSSVFLDRVHYSLGKLATACLDAYEQYGDNRLQEAAYALKAIETIDLECVLHGSETHPLPWRKTATPYAIPIRDANDKPIWKGELSVYLQREVESDTIVECINTVYSLQHKNVEVIENAESRETKENPITDDHISGPTGDIGTKVSSEIVEMVIDVIKSHDRRLKDKVIELTDDIENDLRFDHLDLIECIMEIESKLQSLDPSTCSAIPDDETDGIKTVGDLVALAQNAIKFKKVL